MIAGIIVTPLKLIVSDLGTVMHALKASSAGYSGFGEAYFSQIHEGCVKPWRRHRIVTMNLVVPVGSVQFVVRDDRANSGTRGTFDTYLLGPKNYVRLTVPRGLWVAFRGLGPGTSTILDIIDHEHDPAENDAVEFGLFPFAW